MELTVNNTKAYAYTGGKPFNPELPAVVFIHGAENDHSVWGLQSRWFAHHGFSVLAVDLPGRGRSDGPLLPSVEAQAGWIVVDLGDTVVHLFSAQQREYYRLEDLWSKGKPYLPLQ